MSSRWRQRRSRSLGAETRERPRRAARVCAGDGQGGESSATLGDVANSHDTVRFAMQLCSFDVPGPRLYCRANMGQGRTRAQLRGCRVPRWMKVQAALFRSQHCARYWERRDSGCSARRHSAEPTRHRVLASTAKARMPARRGAADARDAPRDEVDGRDARH